MTSSLIQTSDRKAFYPDLRGNMDCSSVAGVDVENSFGQKVWLNHPSFLHLDLLSPKGSTQLPEMLQSPVFPISGPKAFLLSSPEPLLTLLSMNRNAQDSPAGAPQMCFMPTFEDNGGDVGNPSPLWHGYSMGEFQGDTQHYSKESMIHALDTMVSEEPDHTSPLNQVQPICTLEEGLRIQSLWYISQHAALVDQATRLQKRLLAMLGEHASRHYSRQLEGLRRTRHEISCYPKSPMASGGLFVHSENEIFNAEEMQEEEDALRRIHRYTQTHRQSVNSRDLENLAHCGHAVLHGMLDSLDSDATVSSSSEEEWDHEDAKGTSASSQCHGCEGSWLKDRAELCSRWTWLQMRLTELDSQIQQLGDLHQQILANKGHVVLAESQPLTDRQIQHTLWTETMDLLSDLDMEPSSPTRLLRNIERQSAHLNQIVNSLMPPFSTSPVSKGPCRKHHQKITYSSQVQEDTAVRLPNRPQCIHKTGQKRKRACHQRQYPLQVDVTGVSARTRPLVTYHKPRLFIMDPSSSYRKQVLDSFISSFPRCVSCDSESVYSDPTCPCREEKTAGKVHPVLSLSSGRGRLFFKTLICFFVCYINSESVLSLYLDTPLSFHLHNALHAENLHQRSIPTDLFKPQRFLSSRCTVSRSLFHCSHRPKHGRHLKKHKRESTPIRSACTRDHRKAHRHSEHKRRSRCPTDVSVSDVARWSDLFSLSDDNLVEECIENASDCTPTQQRNSQVERHQCKDILTPSWRRVNVSPLLKQEEVEQDERVTESITDEDFNQRRQTYEHGDELYWSSWNHSIRSSRKSSSAVSVEDHPAHCHPPEDSPVHSTRISSPPEDQTEDIPVPPWRRRVFPLSDEDEEALRCDEDVWASNIWDGPGNDITLWPSFSPQTPFLNCFDTVLV